MRSRCLATSLAAAAIAAVLQTPGSAQFGPAQSGGGNGPEAKVVAKFDKDGDGRLNREERAAARVAFAGVVTAGPGRRGRGATTPAPGPKLTPADVRSPYPTTNLYDLGTLRTIFLQFEEPNWEEELSFFFNSTPRLRTRSKRPLHRSSTSTGRSGSWRWRWPWPTPTATGHARATTTCIGTRPDAFTSFRTT